jgi:hypothetical protein
MGSTKSGVTTTASSNVPKKPIRRWLPHNAVSRQKIK